MNKAYGSCEGEAIPTEKRSYRIQTRVVKAAQILRYSIRYLYRDNFTPALRWPSIHLVEPEQCSRHSINNFAGFPAKFTFTNLDADANYCTCKSLETSTSGKYRGI